MSKYKPLSDRLAAHPADEWRASFSELESVLGFPLPKAALSGRTWWDKGHSRNWVSEGWVLSDVDRATQHVVFRREATQTPEPAPEPELEADEVQPPAMQQAAEAASAQMHANRARGATAMITAGVAVVAGLGVLLLRGVMRRR